MNLIVETDIGHDPDDFFALCYLVSAGVDIRGIMVTPGDPDQIAIAKFFCKEVGLDIPVGASHADRTKLSSGSVHHELLKKYGRSFTEAPDGLGVDLLSGLFDSCPDMEAFVIGPVTSLGKYLAQHPDALRRATMQGGFCGYDLHQFPAQRLPQFEGKTWVPTFNMNGDRSGAQSFLNANIEDRRFVGKNVCHTVLYNKERFAKMSKPKDRASELFIEGMGMYLEKHEEKKFHDPTAAVCHLHPDIGYWMSGEVRKMESGWGTTISVRSDRPGDFVLAHIDYNALWEHIQNWG